MQKDLNKVIDELIKDKSKEIAKKTIEKANKQEIKLVNFATQEIRPEHMQADLMALYDENTAKSLTIAYNIEPTIFVNMVNIRNNVLYKQEQTKKAIKEENSKHDSGRPFAGQILVANVGYNRDCIAFYKVLKASKCFVTIQTLEKKIVENIDGYNQIINVMPGDNFQKGSQPMRRKIKSENEGFYISVDDSYNSARPWDGSPIYEDSLD